MHVLRSTDPGWVSNAFLVWDEPGGTALFVDSGAPLEPFHETIERERLTPTHLLTTHTHHDHVAGDEELVSRYGLERASGSLRIGKMRIETTPTPGHSDDMVAFVIDGRGVFTGDTLFRDSVGGGDFEAIRRSVMDVLMRMSADLDVYPGHAGETTIRREWEENPFVRVWRGAEPEGTERVRVAGRDATLVVWSPDYDGGGKAWVRFADDGRDAIVGGSRVERLS